MDCCAVVYSAADIQISLGVGATDDRWGFSLISNFILSHHCTHRNRLRFSASLPSSLSDSLAYIPVEPRLQRDIISPTSWSTFKETDLTPIACQRCLLNAIGPSHFILANIGSLSALAIQSSDSSPSPFQLSPTAYCHCTHSKIIFRIENTEWNRRVQLAGKSNVEQK